VGAALHECPHPSVEGDVGPFEPLNQLGSDTLADEEDAVALMDRYSLVNG